MRINFTASRLVLAAVCGSALLTVSSPAAVAAPCSGGAVQDPITGTCWTSGDGPKVGTGGVCLPGRLGLCLGALQNSQVPGATLPGADDGWP